MSLFVVGSAEGCFGFPAA